MGSEAEIPDSFEDLLPDPDIIELITQPLKLAERGPTRKRVLDKVVEFVTKFILNPAVEV